MAPRKTLKGRGWNSLLGVGPTRNPNQDVYKSKSGILVSRSKTGNFPIFSRDGGKSWNYIFTTWDAGYEETPLKNAADGFAAFKEMKQDKENKRSQEFESGRAERERKAQEDLQRRIASGDPHNLYPADGEPFRQAWVKEFKLPNDTPFETVNKRYNELQDRRRGPIQYTPPTSSNNYNLVNAVDTGIIGYDLAKMLGGKKTRKNRRKTKRRS